MIARPTDLDSPAAYRALSAPPNMRDLDEAIRQLSQAASAAFEGISASDSIRWRIEIVRRLALRVASDWTELRPLGDVTAPQHDVITQFDSR